MLTKIINEGVEKLKKMEDVLVVSHYDCDGLTSSAIISKALKRRHIRFSLLILKEINEESIKKISEYKIPILFVDIGSNVMIREIDEEIIILDHHEPVNFSEKNITEINPEIFGIHELSSSGTCYLFANAISKENKDMADLALAGAVGDLMTQNSMFTGNNLKILKDAEELGLIRVEKGMRVFGYNSRPIHKALELCFDPYIPNVSGSESGAVQFLSELGIKIRENEKFRCLRDLTDREKLKLHSAIIVNRLANNMKAPEDIFGYNYFMTRYKLEIKEFATIINAFGRLERYYDGIEFCLKPGKKNEEEVLNEYKSLLGKFICWARDNLFIRDEICYILAKDNISPNFISPVATIYSSLVPQKILVGSAYDGDKVKFSIRNRTAINIQNIINEIADMLGGVGGGHREACGATIPKSEEERFIKLLNKSIRKALSG